jgi:hypothetical protein
MLHRSCEDGHMVGFIVALLYIEYNSLTAAHVQQWGEWGNLSRSTERRKETAPPNAINPTSLSSPESISSCEHRNQMQLYRTAVVYTAYAGFNLHDSQKKLAVIVAGRRYFEATRLYHVTCSTGGQQFSSRRPAQDSDQDDCNERPKIFGYYRTVLECSRGGKKVLEIFEESALCPQKSCIIKNKKNKKTSPCICLHPDPLTLNAVRLLIRMAQ